MTGGGEVRQVGLCAGTGRGVRRTGGRGERRGGCGWTGVERRSVAVLSLRGARGRVGWRNYAKNVQLVNRAERSPSERDSARRRERRQGCDYAEG